jgi:ribulose-5-phosphate 4-epimerase/fuculose-1-phosphate aldolase
LNNRTLALQPGKETTLIETECRTDSLTEDLTARATEFQLRREIVLFSKLLHRAGFMPGTSGNLSVRLDDERLLVTPTGSSKFMLRSSDIVIVDLMGRHLSGPKRATSELTMHLAVYEQRNDVAAVVHSHPPTATAFACAGRALDQVLCQEAVMTLGIVPLANSPPPEPTRSPPVSHHSSQSTTLS